MIILFLNDRRYIDISFEHINEVFIVIISVKKIILQEIFPKIANVMLQYLLKISRIDPKYKDDSESSFNFEYFHISLSKILYIGPPNP